MIDQSLAIALRTWINATSVFAAANFALVFFRGLSVYARVFKQGPFSSTPLTLLSVAAVWFGVGAALKVLQPADFRSRHGLTVLCALFVLVLYTNVLRERIAYGGDVHDYISAANDLADNRPFGARYVYPPLLATTIEPFLPLGETNIGYLCWVANVVALCLFYILLAAALTKYRFGNTASPLIALLFCAINVPILRTLGYVQVNLHVANLTLISLLSYPRIPILSALALALAVHLKGSPLVLALPFVLSRDWRWLTAFAATILAIAAVPAIPHGWQPFVSAFHNVRNIYAANGIAFRETSVDSLFRSSAALVGLPLSYMFLPIAVAKIGILAAAWVTTARVLKSRPFIGNGQETSIVYNCFPVLTLFMMLESPLIWEHHPVFVALPFLLVVRLIDTPVELVTYGFAFLLEYWIPTFDFYPWSFARLASPLMLLWLIHHTSSRGRNGSFWGSLTSYGHALVSRAKPMAATECIAAE